MKGTTNRRLETGLTLQKRSPEGAITVYCYLTLIKYRRYLTKSNDFSENSKRAVIYKNVRFLLDSAVEYEQCRWLCAIELVIERNYSISPIYSRKGKLSDLFLNVFGERSENTGVIGVEINK